MVGQHYKLVGFVWVVEIDIAMRVRLRRELGEELPKLKVGPVKLWKEVKAKNRRSGRKMSDAIFVAKDVSGRLKIGDKREIDKAVWRKPRGLRLTSTSRYIRDKLFPKRRR